MKSLLLLLLPTTCFVLFENAYAIEWHTLYQGENLVVIGQLRHEVYSKQLVRSYAQTKADIEKLLGLPLLSKPTVLLIQDKDLFEKLSGSPFVSAFAVPPEQLIVLHISVLPSKTAILHDTLKHELCHLLMHDHISARNLPKWLDEGICEWVSGNLGEILVGDGMTMSRVSTAHRLIPLEQLATTFPQEKDLLLLAYKESEDFVGYVAAHYGPGSLREILKYLKEGDSIDPAISKALSKSFGEVQKEWIEDMRKGREWFVWVSQNLYEMLFLAAAVLTIVAAVRLRLRRANDMDSLDD